MSVLNFPPAPPGLVTSYLMGGGIDWSAPVEEVYLYVELPFWLMLPPGDLMVEYDGISFELTILGPWREVFAGRVTDSRSSVVFQGPQTGKPFQPTGELKSVVRKQRVPLIDRTTRPMLRVKAWAHPSAFTEDERDPSRPSTATQRKYWAALCAANLPIVNALIQQYRLATYDYFAYEVSPWDVPIWYLKYGEDAFTAVLMDYRAWDTKPILIDSASAEERLTASEFEWAKGSELPSLADEPSPGEFDLLDARNLMERGDFSGAVRRTTTAIETVLAAELEKELVAKYGAVVAASKLDASKNDFPGRLRQWMKLSGTKIPQSSIENFEATRQVRHGIVHRGERLGYADGGEAQRMVDTGRWFYNKIERRADRIAVREGNLGLKSAGRIMTGIIWPAHIDQGRLVLGPPA